jgi:hypothetical protein
MVMASTSRAPGMRAGLGTGISKNRQPPPTAKLIARPMTNFIWSPSTTRRTIRRRDAGSYDVFVLNGST